MFEALEAKVNRELLKSAVMSQIFCPCGNILDVRHSVLVEFGDRTGVLCGTCYHLGVQDRLPFKTILKDAMSKTQASHPEADVAKMVKVYDGAELERTRAPRKRIPKDMKPEASQYPSPTKPEPTMDVLEDWMMDGTAESTDGCIVEPDGTCEHGHPSWLRYLGIM